MLVAVVVVGSRAFRSTRVTCSIQSYCHSTKTRNYVPFSHRSKEHGP